MSVYISLFLVVFVPAAIAVLMYRWLSNSQSVKRIEIGIPALTAWFRSKIRQGMMMLTTASRERVKQVTLRTPKDGFKTPWGW